MRNARTRENPYKTWRKGRPREVARRQRGISGKRGEIWGPHPAIPPDGIPPPPPPAPLPLRAKAQENQSGSEIDLAPELCFLNASAKHRIFRLNSLLFQEFRKIPENFNKNQEQNFSEFIIFQKKSFSGICGNGGNPMKKVLIYFF